jgi:hypothetical protein
LTKPLPVTVSVKLPVLTDGGAMPPSTGTGFNSVTALAPLALESAALTACTVTVFGFGKLAGAEYMPDELIVPVDELPPVTPFTCQVTDVFDEPLTVALNGWVAPARTLAGFGETETATAGGGAPAVPGFPEELLVTPAHRA